MSRVAAPLTLIVTAILALAACSEDVPLGGADAPSPDAPSPDAAETFTVTAARAGSGSGVIISSPAGINCGADCTQDYPAGTIVTLAATPAAGSTFLGWSGGGCTGTGTCTVASTATVIATFGPPATASLTVTLAGAGSGTVVSSPAGITCGADCTQDYPAGTVVTLVATAASGSTFTGWSGACAGTAPTCAVTIAAAVAVTATFDAVPQCTVTALRTGTGTGTVTSAPAGIACGATCTATFACGTLVTLTATPAAGSTFTGWSGAGCTGTGTCSFLASSAVTATAAFTTNTATLTVTRSGTGLGTVTGTGISCGADCTESYLPGTVVTLVATAASGSTFAGWSGACTGTSTTCTVTVATATNVDATFNAIPTPIVTVARAGTGTGTVISSPPGINCGTDCSEVYPAGTTVTLVATAASGSLFTGWSGACTGTSPTCTITVSGPVTVTATFVIADCSFTVVRGGTGTGTVTSSPAGIACGVDCTEILPCDSIITVTATPASGSTFSGWSGGGCSGTGACVVSVSSSITVVASFALN